MKSRGYLAIAIALLCLLAATPAAQANGPAWSYIEAGYNNVDLDDVSDEGDGYFVGGSFGRKSLHVFGRYIDNSTDNNLDITKWYAGAGWHGMLGERMDLFADAAYVDADYDTADDSGYFGRAGIRARLIDLLEVGANARFEDLGDLEDDVVWEANAMVYIWRVAIGLAYETQDDFDTYNLFARFNLGN